MKNEKEGRTATREGGREGGREGAEIGWEKEGSGVVYQVGDVLYIEH